MLSFKLRQLRSLTSALLIAAMIIALAPPSVCLAGPAPPLTQVRVIDVMSTGYGFISYSDYFWDPVYPGAVATTQDHYGPYLFVAVLETGYAQPSSRQALFNGNNMTLVNSIPQYGPYPYVTGWVQIYGYYGNWTSGTFQYQATSMVVPIKTLSTRLYIR
jgi:hypothetical protein